LIHGCLHVLGMDHLRAADRARMRALEAHLRWELGRLA
jgi:ssRNA-specific RNase YbeY (16S rRNA maturation enzyme)